MELLFLYIKDYRNILVEKQFNFSSNYKVSFENGHLNIEPKENPLKDYYGTNISNITLFLGKNGVGKTTILDILGMKRGDREKDRKVSKHNFVNHQPDDKILAEYFIVYHVKDEQYLIEFSEILSDNKTCMIKNIDFRGMANPERFNHSCDSIIVQRSAKDSFVYDEAKRIGNLQIEYSYALIQPNNPRILETQQNRDYRENEYMIQRNYYLGDASNLHMYKYYKELNQRRINRKGEPYIMKVCNITPNLMRGYTYEQGELIEKGIDNVKKMLGFSSIDEKELRDRMFRDEKDIDNEKQYFLSLFCCNAILYYFFNRIVFWKWGAEAVNTVKWEMEEKDLAKYKRGQLIPNNLQEEYEIFLSKIKSCLDNNTKVKYQEVLLYLVERYEAIANEQRTEISDKEAINGFLKLLQQIGEKHFKKDDDNNIIIPISCIKEETHSTLEELIKAYDSYINKGNELYGHNQLSSLIEISHPRLSEGYQALATMLAKVNDELSKKEVDDSSILLLDEPDRSLHPELARNFVKYLVEEVNIHQIKNVQIVLTSHSPFIVTDILPESVYALLQEEDGIITIQENTKTYVTNIYMLLMDSFMLSNTFGEYSNIKIQEVVQHLLQEGSSIQEEDRKMDKAIIDRIGESVLKNKLLKLYTDKYGNAGVENKRFIIERINQLDEKFDKNKLDEIKKVLEL